MPNKTGRNDARGIAQIMRTGWYRAVHVKSPSCRAWRALLTARRMVLGKRRDIENELRALLREVGLKVGAHLSLTPRRYQSGETDVQGRISRCGDELARTALYEAAHSLLIRRTRWSALRAWGMQIAKRRGMARARVAVARKLAVILHRMWRDGTEFHWGKLVDTATVGPC
jgi:transposase